MPDVEIVPMIPQSNQSHSKESWCSDVDACAPESERWTSHFLWSGANRETRAQTDVFCAPTKHGGARHPKGP